RVFAPDGNEVVFQGAQDPHTPVGQGWLRASHRKLDRVLTLPYRPYHAHDDRWPLVPGMPVELDIEIWPTCIVVPAGYRIALSVCGKDYAYEGGPAQLPGVKHSVTGAGNPDWLALHAPASRTAPVVQRLVDSGANMIGKTHTDELSRGILGENAHYGTPINPKAPGRVPGGSSSGSAAAVAGGLVDFALGTDTGGSVRIPASFCGIYGIRTTH